MKEFNINQLIEENFGQNYQLHGKYMNRTFATVLKTIGFDKVYKKAKGSYLYDADGNDYLDFLSGYGVFGIGRNHPTLIKTIKDVLDLDLPNMVQMDCSLLSGLLAQKLSSLLGNNLEASFFCNSGTEANEGALKFAKAHTKKSKILSFKGAYHGLSYGSLSITHSKHFQDGYGPLMQGAIPVEFNNLQDLEDKLKAGDVAAFIFECVQGKGVNIPDPDYFPKAQLLCKKYNALFIADEVQTGLGRTGKMFAFQHWNLQPDIVTVAKTLSGGYVPVAAFITTREIHQSSFSSLDKCVVHSTTFGRNNLAMACGLTTISVLESENLIQNSEKMGKLLLDKLNALKEKHSYIKEVRGLGLMLAIEFKEPSSLKQKLAWKALKSAEDVLFTQMVVTSLIDKHRILSHVASHGLDAVKILPPYIISEVEVDRFVNALDEVLSSAANITGPLWTFGKRLISAAIENKKNK